QSHRSPFMNTEPNTETETSVSTPQECGGSPENAHGNVPEATAAPASPRVSVGPPPVSPWSAADAEAASERTARVARKRELLAIFFVLQPGALSDKRARATEI